MGRSLLLKPRFTNDTHKLRSLKVTKQLRINGIVIPIKFCNIFFGTMLIYLPFNYKSKNKI